MRSVQVHNLGDGISDGVGLGAAEPARSNAIRADGNVLRIVEHDVAVYVWVGGAVERTDVKETRRPVRSMGWEQLVEEGCGTIEQDGLWSEVEVGVCGFGGLVAVELVLGQN